MIRLICLLTLVGVWNALAADVEAVFNLNCATCHGKDGRARNAVARKLGVKDLSESKATDAEIQKQILEGKKSTEGKPLMPPFKEKVASSDLPDLVDYVKKFRKQAQQPP